MDFKEQLKELLKKRELSDSSINLYVRNLERLNNNKPLKNLSFLSKVDDIKEKLTDYKDNTRRAFLISIVSSLNALKGNNKRLEKLYKTYYDMMIDINKYIREQPTEKKSETQENNWIDWDEVKEKYNEIIAKVPIDKKELSEKEYQHLLDALILSLYIELPPRRNQDYSKMVIVKDITDKTPKDKNYLDLNKKQFVFNVYKTSKKYGEQIVNIPDKHFELILTYIKYHPLTKKFYNNNKGTFKKNIEVPFLIKYDGTPLNKINSITRVLNRIFKKNVGSSMLRHIYLSGKYDGVLDEQKKDAELMGHSTNQQRDYIKTDDNSLTPSPVENITMKIEKKPRVPNKKKIVNI